MGVAPSRFEPEFGPNSGHPYVMIPVGIEPVSSALNPRKECRLWFRKGRLTNPTESVTAQVDSQATDSSAEPWLSGPVSGYEFVSGPTGPALDKPRITFFCLE